MNHILLRLEIDAVKSFPVKSKVPEWFILNFILLLHHICMCWRITVVL